MFPLELRSEANLEVIIVTDDNGRGANNLAKDFASIPGKNTIVNAIVGLAKGLSPTNPKCSIPNVGTEHMTLAQQTGGQVFDLCEKDWNLLLKKLSESVIKNSVKPMILKHAPAAAEKIEVKLDGVAIPSSGFEIGADGRSVIFKMPIEKQGKIIISYETKE